MQVTYACLNSEATNKSIRAWERLADKFALLEQRGMHPQIVTGSGAGIPI